MCEQCKVLQAKYEAQLRESHAALLAVRFLTELLLEPPLPPDEFEDMVGAQADGILDVIERGLRDSGYVEDVQLEKAG